MFRAGKNLNVAMESVDHLKREELIADALACPCVDDMKNGPCAVEFVSAYSCFLRSQDDESKEPEDDGEGEFKCVQEFMKMQDCMAKNEDYYKEYLGGGDDDDEDGGGAFPMGDTSKSKLEMDD